MTKFTKRTAAKFAPLPGRADRRRLPEWNLNDLYRGLDDPAIKRDLDHADAECADFETAYKGKLAELAATPEGGSSLAEAVRRL